MPLVFMENKDSNDPGDFVFLETKHDLDLERYSGPGKFICKKCGNQICFGPIKFITKTHQGAYEIEGNPPCSEENCA